MGALTTYMRRMRLLLIGAVLGLLIQAISPIASGAAPPTGPDVAPTSAAKPADATGSGGGKEQTRRVSPAAKSSAPAPLSADAIKRTGTPTKREANAPSASPHVASNLQYYPLSQPIRFYDSRPGDPAFANNGTPDVGGLSYRNIVAGITYQGVTIPTSALAVTGNVTVVADQRSGPGFVTLYPDFAPLPTTSNANYVDEQVVPNAFTVALGANGAFRDYVSTTIDIVLDITGYYAAPGTGGLYFHTLARPMRLLDTRPSASAFYTPGAPHLGGLTYVDGVAGISFGGVSIPGDATAVSGNATVVADQSAGPGFLTLFPDGAALPTVSNNNYVDGQVVPNAFFVGLGGGALDLYNLTTIDVIVDINGYFSSSLFDFNGTGVQYNALAYPIRMMDSRPGSVSNGSACTGGFNGGFTGGGNFIIRGGGFINGVQIVCQGIAIPSSAVAVTGNATVVADFNSGPGFITLFPPGVSRPLASNLNYVNGQVVPNFFVVGVGPVTATNSGNVYTNAFLTYALTTVDEIFDLNGYFA
jgi:hypothetical protein